LYKITKKSKVSVIPNLRGSELAQAAKLMMYITADIDDVALVFVKFEEWHSAISPLGGHTVASIVRLQRTISEYDAALKASQMSTVQVAGMATGVETVTSHKLSHLPEAPGAQGYANAGDTTFSEKHHKFVKRAWEHTSKRPKTVQNDVCNAYSRTERVLASVATTSASPTTTQSTSLLRALPSNAAVGAHPVGRLRLDGICPRTGPTLPSLDLNEQPAHNLWAPDSLASAASASSQHAIVTRALREYYTACGRDVDAMQRSLRDTDIDLCAGIRLFDSEDAHRVIGIARAPTRWGGGVRYNDVRVVLTASTFVYARMALVMRVLGEDLVLIRTYREPTNIGQRSLARKRLDELLGTILEYVPPSNRDAWLIVPAASVVDVWKVEDDVRKRGRFFLNQFVGAYRPLDDGEVENDASDDEA